MQTFLTDLRHGRFELIRGDMISEISEHYGEWSEVEVSVLRHLLDSSCNVVEIGANLGLHSVPLGKTIAPVTPPSENWMNIQLMSGKLLCFEPQKSLFSILQKNLHLNGLTNVVCYQKGVSDSNDTIQIETTDYRTPWNYGAFSLKNGFSNELAFTGEVGYEALDVVALDDFAPVQALSRLDLLKIDAEGLDFQVLRGARKTIATFQPIIFTECDEAHCDSLIAKLEKLGYQPFWLLSARYQEKNFRQNPPYFTQGVFDADLNLLAFPQSMLNALARGELPLNFSAERVARLYQVLAILAKAESFAQFKRMEIKPLKLL